MKNLNYYLDELYLGVYFRVTKSRKMRWTGQAARMDDRINLIQGFFVEMGPAADATDASQP
jgi:hypothetical protein